MTASTRNPLHLVAGSNDYRTVDLPGLPDDSETGDAWVSVYKSFDGGDRWSSTLMPGYPQDTSAVGMASPLKGYQAAADPVVRAGTSGLIYYNGLVFNRGENGASGIFVSRFVDQNNKENGDPIAFLGTSMVVTSDGSTFLDKPWMAVDLPRGNAGYCAVGGAPTAGADDDDEHGRGGRVQRNGHRRRGDSRRRGNQPPDDGYVYVQAGAVYVAYTAITGTGATLQSQIYVKRSMDCGATWSAPMRVSNPGDQINQGATLAIAPATGDLFVAWRRFSPPSVTDADAVMVARLRVNGNSFDAPGKAWGLRRTSHDDDAAERIFEHRRRRATPTVAASVAQLDQGTSPYSFRTNAYPTMAIDGTGRAYVAWSERGYATARPDSDSGDARIRVATTTDGRTFSAPVVVDDSPTEPGHQLMPSLAFAGGRLLLVFYDLRETRARVFGPFVTDQGLVTKRQTIDIRAALATPGAVPSFAPSVRVSDYLLGYRNSTALLEQLQVNPPNLPMFRQGTVPFIGDYIDVSPSPAFVPTAAGGWAFNTAAGSQIPVFHAAWTDNRDVRAPLDGNWANYTPPTFVDGTGTSIFDPSQSVAVCVGGNAGSRNQNIYTARIGGGLIVGAPGNAKPLSPTVQRAFVVFAQNQTTVTRTFRMTILAQPAGGRASFEQFPLPPYTASSAPPQTFVDVRVPPRSTAARTVYATGTNPKAQLAIDVSEIAAVGGAPVAGGLAGRVVLNPDIENPDIENPDIENPDIENPDIENGTISDVTWTVSNIGNTTAAFNVNVFLAAAAVPSGINTQLVVYKTYKTPVLDPDGCTLRTETQNVLLFNVPSPNFITPGEACRTRTIRRRLTPRCGSIPARSAV
ncbi:MAG: sialidase family protein [Vicinamibacterales bacterium]